ncbi:MAG: gluconate transporter [Flavobacteriales bacterium 32-35-8]|nr:MAG: gluconate transporter [Flavobacteriales bacterium 32-35-8]
MIYIIALLVALTFLTVGIVKFKIHPFFVLLITSLAYGFISGMNVEQIIDSINSGFGSIMGKIGLIIVFGVTIGKVLEKSGGALVLATKILKIIGEKSIHLAMMVTGYILSIPIFADSALLIMTPLNKALSHKAGISFAGTTTALAIGLTATHVMVPPTPGPIAAAGILNANLGDVIIWGLIVSAISLIPGYFYATRITSKIKLYYKLEKVVEITYQPSLLKSSLPILLPLLLIMFKAIIDYPSLNIEASIFTQFISFFGTPVIALFVGVFFSLIIPKKLDEKILSSNGWLGESLKVAAPIILITGAGGVFGAMLQNSGIGDIIASGFSGMEIGLFFPFLLAAGLKTTQGSSTVALVTTASIVAPILPALGLDDPFLKVMTVLAIGAGSSVVSQVNDSFFWVLTQLTGMNVRQGYQVQTVGTLIFGVTAMIIIFIITLII